MNDIHCKEVEELLGVFSEVKMSGEMGGYILHSSLQVCVL